MTSRNRLAAVVAAVAVLLSIGTPAALATQNQPKPSKLFAVIDIDRIGNDRLEALKRAPGIEGWVECDRELLVYGNAGFERELQKTTSLRVVAENVDPTDLRILQGSISEATGVRVLAHGGRMAVILASPAQLERLAHGMDREQGCGRAPHSHVELHPFIPNVSLAHQLANDPPLPKDDPRTQFSVPVQSLVDQVNGPRWLADVTTFATYNRYTRGAGIASARDWLVAQFQTLPGMVVTTPSFTVTGGGGTTAYNVVATLTGTTRPNDWYIVGGHYDAISNDNGQATAHGAEDNGSGSIGVLEMARVFAANPPDATIIFVCYSGEEQGLFGGTDHASDIVAAGDTSKVKAVLTMDMIGYTGDSDYDCLLETGNIGQFMQTAYSMAASQYTSLRIVLSLNPFGSDHVPYLNRGMPAMLTIENDWDSYPGYHNSGDVIGNVSLTMGYETLKMNVAALAQMAGSIPTGNGTETIGIYDQASGNFFLKNTNAAGNADLTFSFGAGGQGFVPLAGDWNADGRTTIGVYQPTTGTFFLRNTNANGAADVTVNFGPGGSAWTPIVGDWDGNGTDTIGIYNSSTSTFFLKNSNTPGAADLAFTYGPAGATAVAGDWDGNGTDSIGVYVGASAAFFLRNSNSPGAADIVFTYGPSASGMLPLIGDWNSDNEKSVGLYQTSGGFFFLRNSNTPGAASATFGFGPSSGFKPVAGDWDAN